MTSKLLAVTLQGLKACKVTVEVSLQRGLPNINIVGLPDMAVRESKERIRAAFVAAKQEFPRSRVTISLAPAEVKKSGAGFDLPIAVAILVAQNKLAQPNIDWGFLGELGLDGSVRAVRGALPLALGLKKFGIKVCFVARGDAQNLHYIPGLKIYPVKTLKQIIEILKSKCLPQEQQTKVIAQSNIDNYKERLDDLVGLELAKRALTIAAAGRHHLLLLGPPGTGKTILARCLANLVPDLSAQEQIEANALWSIYQQEHKWFKKVPFRAPHHSASAASLMGGGTQLLPGDISLAHLGVLFLDEFAEFRRDVLEQLRQPLEEGVVRLSRASQRADYPARFQLIAASNPCPCGYLGDYLKACCCSPGVLQRYQQRLSGPIKDRLDLTVWVPRNSIIKSKSAKSDQKVKSEHQQAKEQIAKAQQAQLERALKYKIPFKNGSLSGPQVRQIVPINGRSKTLLMRAEDKLGLSPRGIIKILKVARTIADLAGSEQVNEQHLSEALQYRDPTPET